MPNKETDIDDRLEAIIDGTYGDDEWQDLDADAQDDLLLLADVAEAVCRTAPPADTEAGDTDEAWARMSARIHGGKRHRLRIAFMAVAAAAAAVVLALLLVSPAATSTDEGRTAEVRPQVTHKPRKATTNGTARVEKQPEKAAKPAAAYTVTASTRGSLGSARQLIIDLQNQGYAVDKHVQRTSQPVQPGKLGKVTLPDGTEAYLYASSKITYPSVFVGDAREVALEGEAYFKVRHDASHPFIIHASGAETRVLGTELDVRAYQGEPLHVALITGVAEVAGGGGVCRLKPGEGVTLLKDGMTKGQEDMDVYTYALRGMLYADNAPMAEVLQMLARWYGMTVSASGHEGMESRIHFFMRGSDSPQHAASLLTGMGVCTVTVDGDRFVVGQRETAR